MSADCSLAECLQFFDDILTTLRSGFAAIEDAAPKPIGRVRSGNFEVRYNEPTLELALVLKLARDISLLGALRIMVERGLVQEQGILKRAIDETDEDILFLSFGRQTGIEQLHNEFLDAFWAEEFDDPNNAQSAKRRKSVPRRKIQAYNSRISGAGNPSTSQSISRQLQGVFSGFVHGASTHIMDMYDPKTGRFRTDGLNDSPIRDSYTIDSANYPYRVLMSAVMIARRLGLSNIADGFHRKVRESDSFVGLIDGKPNTGRSPT